MKQKNRDHIAEEAHVSLAESQALEAEKLGHMQNLPE